LERVPSNLTPDDLRDIGRAVSKITVQGARYPEKLEQMTRSLSGRLPLWVRERTRFAGEVAREVARSAGAAMIG
jgi:hypothetical protein